MGRTARAWHRLRSNGIVAIAAGTGLGQLVAVIAAPLLSRLYTPRDFGSFVVASSIALTLGAFASLRLESAVPLPERDDDARGLVRLALISSVATTVAVGGLLVALSGQIHHWTDGSTSTAALAGSAAIGGVVAVYRVLNQWALRFRLYVLAARRSVVQSVVTVAVQVGAGLAGLAQGLLLGMGAGQSAGVAGLVVGSASLRYEEEPPRARTLLRRYRSFPLALAPASLLNTAGLYLPLIVFAALYGPVAAGLLGFTQRILAMPMTLVGQAVAQVYLAELANGIRTGSDSGRRLFLTASRRLAAVGLLAAVLLLATGPWAFDLVFGHAWRLSGSMAQALGPALAAQLVASTLSQTLIVLERTGVQLAWDASRLVLTVGAVVVASALGMGPLAAVWLLSAASVATYAASWELSRRALHAA